MTVAGLVLVVVMGIAVIVGYMLVRLGHPAGHQEPVPGAAHDGEPPHRGGRRARRPR